MIAGRHDQTRVGPPRLDPSRWRRTPTFLLRTVVTLSLCALFLAWNPAGAPVVAAQVVTLDPPRTEPVLPTPSKGDPILPGDGSAPIQAEEPGTRSFLNWMVEASGPIGWLILILSFYLVALVIWMALKLRREVAIPTGLVRELEELLDQKAYSDAFQRVSADDSYLARCLAAGLRKLPSGPAAARRAMETANEDAAMEFEHRITYLATVGTLGPMIGLVGTVYGMIISFRVIATAGAAPQASDLAMGISTALFATLEGVSLSIPAIYFHALFRNKIARISLDVETACEHLFERFAKGYRAPHPLASGGGMMGGGNPSPAAGLSAVSLPPPRDGGGDPRSDPRDD
mgnify:CR=1 FL=1